MEVGSSAPLSRASPVVVGGPFARALRLECHAICSAEKGFRLGYARYVRRKYVVGLRGRVTRPKMPIVVRAIVMCFERETGTALGEFRSAAQLERSRLCGQNWAVREIENKARHSDVVQTGNSCHHENVVHASPPRHANLPQVITISKTTDSLPKKIKIRSAKACLVILLVPRALVCC